MTILSILATASGMIMGLANMPQAYKIFKRKSAKDISIWTYGSFFVGSIIWILYGLEEHDYAIILANGIGSVSLACVIVGWIKYR